MALDHITILYHWFRGVCAMTASNASVKDACTSTIPLFDFVALLYLIYNL